MSLRFINEVLSVAFQSPISGLSSHHQMICQALTVALWSAAAATAALDRTGGLVWPIQSDRSTLHGDCEAIEPRMPCAYLRNDLTAALQATPTPTRTLSAVGMSGLILYLESKMVKNAYYA